MLKRLVVISRPVLWINTIGTAVVAMWLTGTLLTVQAIAMLLWVTLPFNLLIYGVNDIFDRETDELNSRKGGFGGARIFSSDVRAIVWGVAITNVPFLVYFAFSYSAAANAWIWAYALVFVFYSAPPLRFKARPFFDSISNAAYAFPLAFVPLALGDEPWWFALAGLMVWSMAKHTFDAIQDIEEDRAVGIRTTAVTMGVRGALLYVSVLWLVSTMLFTVVSVPVAFANALYAAWLVWLMSKDQTPANARRVYKYSVAFPYVVGTFAGMLLIAALVLGLVG